MELKALYREIVNEHNLHPSHKKKLAGATMTLEGVNPSCGDDIELQLLIKDGVIEDAAFNGSGCAISQASCDMMCDRIIGEKKEDALALAQNFMGMIKGTATDEQIETLDESAALTHDVGDGREAECRGCGHGICNCAEFRRVRRLCDKQRGCLQAGLSGLLFGTFEEGSGGQSLTTWQKGEFCHVRFESYEKRTGGFDEEADARETFR